MRPPSTRSSRRQRSSHTGKIQAFPLVLVGRSFWDPLISFFAGQEHAGAIADCTTSHFFVTDSPADAVDHIRTSGARPSPLGYSRPLWPAVR